MQESKTSFAWLQEPSGNPNIWIVLKTAFGLDWRKRRWSNLSSRISFWAAFGHGFPCNCVMQVGGGTSDSKVTANRRSLEVKCPKIRGNLPLNTAMCQGKPTSNASMVLHGFPRGTRVGAAVLFYSVELILKIRQQPGRNKFNIVFFLSPLGLWKYTVEDYKVNSWIFCFCCVHSFAGQFRVLVIVSGL